MRVAPCPVLYVVFVYGVAHWLHTPAIATAACGVDTVAVVCRFAILICWCCIADLLVSHCCYVVCVADMLCHTADLLAMHC